MTAATAPSLARRDGQCAGLRRLFAASLPHWQPRRCCSPARASAGGGDYRLFSDLEIIYKLGSISPADFVFFFSVCVQIGVSVHGVAVAPPQPARVDMFLSASPCRCVVLQFSNRSGFQDLAAWRNKQVFFSIQEETILFGCIVFECSVRICSSGCYLLQNNDQENMTKL